MGIYRLLWLFIIYSFAGWLLEVISVAFKHKRFENKGLVNSPFCMIYGVAACLITVFFRELTGIWLFLASMLTAALLEWSVGHIIVRIFHEKWWDYTDSKWNLDGYVSLPMSVLWGILGFATVKWGNIYVVKLYDLLPQALAKVVVWAIIIMLIIDIAATVIILSGYRGNIKIWMSIDEGLDKVSSGIVSRIYGYIDRRITKAYPEAVTKEKTEDNKNVFAYGCSFHKIIWLFVIGAFLGDIVETIFCRITAGVWMSRSSLVWGQFSIVWGLAVAVATVLLYQYRDRSDSFIFVVGTFLGGAYEYICSVFTEKVFGKVFWDYSGIPFNLNGRINLLYCFFWGIAAVVWIKKLYPVLSRLIEKVPVRVGKLLTWITVIFMCVNMIVSALALVRMDQRENGVAADSKWQQVMDKHFDDDILKRIYPNQKAVK
ncbi:MAG: hypothetical protein ACI4E1_10905 [Lachnospira sp.]